MEIKEHKIKSAYNKGVIKAQMDIKRIKSGDSDFTIIAKPEPTKLVLKWQDEEADKLRFENWINLEHSDFEDNFQEAVANTDVVLDVFEKSGLSNDYRLFSGLGLTDAEGWECFENGRVYSDFRFYATHTWLEKLYNEGSVELMFVGMYISADDENVDVSGDGDDLIVSEALYQKWEDGLTITDDVLEADDIN